MKRHKPHFYTCVYRTVPNVAKMRKYGVHIYHVSRYSPIITVMVTSKSQLNKIVTDPNIVSVSMDQVISLPSPKIETIIPAMRAARSRSPKQALTWNVARVLGGSPRLNYGAGVKVGVIDTGIDFKHPELQSNVKGGINIVEPSKPPQDDNGHGTHVAGIIGAQNNGFRTVGVAPGVSLYAIKVLNQKGAGTITTLIKGIEWGIQHGMHILNISISGSMTIPSGLRQAINVATQRGILVIAAAGNSGSASGKGDTVLVPARMSSVTAVAALDQNNKRCPFSATGPALNIAAPGANILSTYTNNRYAVLSGTSMAAPHVTGIAAILKQTNPSARPLVLKRMLRQRAKDLPPKGVDRLTGAGLVQLH